MDVTGEYSFNAPVDRVWAVLLDRAALERCMPGCEQLTDLGRDQYEATLSVGVGPVKGTFQAKITVGDQDPPTSYVLTVEGNGSPGFVRGRALVCLEERGQGTLVKVQGEAQVGGLIARVGERLIGTVNKSMMDRFFGCLTEEVG